MNPLGLSRMTPGERIMYDAWLAAYNPYGPVVQGGPGFWDDVGTMLVHPLSTTGGGALGLVQGVLNTANGLQDSAIGLANLPAMAVNGIAWAEEQAGILDANDPLRVPYIPSPDWAKDRIVREDPKAELTPRYMRLDTMSEYLSLL